MDEIISIEDIRQMYHDLMMDTCDCVTRRDVQKGYVVWTRINKLLSIIIPMLRTRETLNMKVNLNAMKLQLRALQFAPLPNLGLLNQSNTE